MPPALGVLTTLNTVIFPTQEAFYADAPGRIRRLGSGSRLSDHWESSVLREKAEDWMAPPAGLEPATRGLGNVSGPFHGLPMVADMPRDLLRCSHR